MLFVVAEVESAAFETSNFAALSRLGRGRAGNPLHAVHFATDGGAHGVTRPTCSVPGNSCLALRSDGIGWHSNIFEP